MVTTDVLLYVEVFDDLHGKWKVGDNLARDWSADKYIPEKLARMLNLGAEAQVLRIDESGYHPRVVIEVADETEPVTYMHKRCGIQRIRTDEVTEREEHRLRLLGRVARKAITGYYKSIVWVNVEDKEVWRRGYIVNDRFGYRYGLGDHKWKGDTDWAGRPMSYGRPKTETVRLASFEEMLTWEPLWLLPEETADYEPPFIPWLFTKPPFYGKARHLRDNKWELTYDAYLLGKCDIAWDLEQRLQWPIVPLEYQRIALGDPTTGDDFGI